MALPPPVGQKGASPMYAVLKSFGLKGLNGFPVEVEADISGGMPALSTSACRTLPSGRAATAFMRP